MCRPAQPLPYHIWYLCTSELNWRNIRKAGFSVNEKRGDETDIHAEWRAEFEAAAERPLDIHLKYALIHTYKPVLDDEPYRSFESTKDYREWCNSHLPKWLGYGTD